MQSLCNRRLVGGGASRERTRLAGRLPDQQGRYREFARSRAVAVAVGAEQSRISIFLGLISLQAVTGNGIATSRELSGRSRARKPAEVCPEKGKPRGQRQRHDRAVPLGMSGRKGEQNQRRRILRTDRRGSNENFNGLLRQYLPKRVSQAGIAQRDCDAIAKELNTRPRKRLGYRTPEECFLGN